MLVGRIAHAVRGLKSSSCLFRAPDVVSHRSRGAWIEISNSFIRSALFPSHRSRGAWIEIVQMASGTSPAIGRIAHAVRGLKSVDFSRFKHVFMVASLTRCVD